MSAARFRPPITPRPDPLPESAYATKATRRAAGSSEGRIHLAECSHGRGEPLRFRVSGKRSSTGRLPSKAALRHRNRQRNRKGG